MIPPPTMPWLPALFPLLPGGGQARVFRSSRGASGFSLLELLVVIAIISVLSGLALVGFNSISRGAGVRGAANLAASMAQSARMEAMSQGKGALLVIDNGGTPEQRWRRMAIFRGVENTSNPGQTDYVLVRRPMQLPANAYFLQSDSRGFGTTNLSLPGATNRPLFFYKFASNGQLVAPGADPPPDDFRLVFGSGPLDASGELTSEQARAGREGIVIRRNGRPVPFEPKD